MHELKPSVKAQGNLHVTWELWRELACIVGSAFAVSTAVYCTMMAIIRWYPAFLITSAFMPFFAVLYGLPVALLGWQVVKFLKKIQQRKNGINGDIKSYGGRRGRLRG